MHAYVISLPHRADRRAHMAALLDAMAAGPASYEFVDPVPVSEVPPGYPADVSRGALSLNRTLAEVVFPAALAAGHEHFLVLEDDLMVLGDPAEVLPSAALAVADLDAHVGAGAWDMLYLEYCFERCGQVAPVTPRVGRAVRPFCTAAIVYSRAGASRAAACLAQERRMTGFSYAACMADGRLRAYVSTPPLFAQDASLQGDIEHTASPLRLHWWLNKVVRMYPEGATSQPRLPACRRDVFGYVRWPAVLVLVLLLGVAGAAAWAALTRVKGG